MRALEEAENWGMQLLLPRVRPARAVARTCGLRAFGLLRCPGAAEPHTARPSMMFMSSPRRKRRKKKK